MRRRKLIIEICARNLHSPRDAQRRELNTKNSLSPERRPARALSRSGILFTAQEAFSACRQRIPEGGGPGGRGDSPAPSDSVALRGAKPVYAFPRISSAGSSFSTRSPSGVSTDVPMSQVYDQHNQSKPETLILQRQGTLACGILVMFITTLLPGGVHLSTPSLSFFPSSKRRSPSVFACECSSE